MNKCIYCGEKIGIFSSQCKACGKQSAADCIKKVGEGQKTTCPSCNTKIFCVYDSEDKKFYTTFGGNTNRTPCCDIFQNRILPLVKWGVKFNT